MELAVPRNRGAKVTGCHTKCWELTRSSPHFSLFPVTQHVGDNTTQALYTKPCRQRQLHCGHPQMPNLVLRLLAVLLAFAIVQPARAVDTAADWAGECCCEPGVIEARQTFLLVVKCTILAVGLYGLTSSTSSWHSLAEGRFGGGTLAAARLLAMCKECRQPLSGLWQHAAALQHAFVCLPACHCTVLRLAPTAPVCACDQTSPLG